MARPTFKPTIENRNAVEKMACIRTSEDQIAYIIGIDPKTLRKYFSVELKRGSAKGEVNLRQKAYQMAMDGDTGIMKKFMDQMDARRNRGYQLDGSGEAVSQGEVRAKLESLLNRRAAAVKHLKDRREELSSRGSEW